jgi:hypothetical protein
MNPSDFNQPLRLLAFLFIGSVAQAAVQSIPLPGQSWEIVIDAPVLGAREDSFTNGQYTLRGHAEDLILSLFVEYPAVKKGDNKACREFYWSRGSRNPAIRKDSVKISSNERCERVEYLIAPPGIPDDRVMRNVNYFFAHEGRWVDVHISCKNVSLACDGIVAAFDRGLLYREAANLVGEPARGGFVERVIALPNRTAVVFAVPAKWCSAAAWPPKDLPPAVEFTPASGDDFKFTVTLGYRQDGRPGQPTGEDVRRMTSASMARIQPSAKEKLELIEWTGAKASGFYYFATDKAPKIGEYPYLLQGVARMDELVVNYMVLMRSKSPKAVAEMLSVLRTLHRHAEGAN